MADWQDRYYDVSDGLRLYARDYPGPSPTAPAALLMHGLTRNSADFAAVAPTLAATHRVLVVEQRGRGRSAYDPNIHRYQIPTYIGDMFELLAQLGLERVAAVGTSMGGLMAMGMHAINPQLFSHVVLNDIGPVLATAGLDRIKSYVGVGSRFPTWQAASDHVRTINRVAFPDYTDADWLAFAQRTCREEGEEVVLDYDAGISQAMQASESAAVPPDLWALFEGLRSVPTLLVRGEISDLLDEPTTLEMRRRYPEMAFLEVPRVGHAPMLDEPGVAERIADFINSR